MTILLRPSLLMPIAVTLVLFGLRLVRDFIVGPLVRDSPNSQFRAVADIPPDWFLGVVWVALIAYFVIARVRGWHVAITEKGIEDGYTLSRLGFIPWEDIADLTVVSGRVFSRLDMIFKTGSMTGARTANRKLLPSRDSKEAINSKPQRSIILDLDISQEQARQIERLYQEKR